MLPNRRKRMYDNIVKIIKDEKEDWIKTEGDKINLDDYNHIWEMADSGEAFKKLVGELEHEGKSKEQAEGLAAYIGRKKYGKEAFQKKAAAGK